MLPPLIEQVGCRIRTIGTLADLDAAELLAELADDLGLDAGAAIRAMRGTRLAGHAVLFLIEQGQFEEGDGDSDIDSATALGPVVDSLAVIYDDDDPLMVIGQRWPVDLPETIEVLEALGRLHPDKAVAKAARRAVIQHRSRYPR